MGKTPDGYMWRSRNTVPLLALSHIGSLWIRQIPQSTRIIVPSRTIGINSFNSHFQPLCSAFPSSFAFSLCPVFSASIDQTLILSSVSFSSHCDMPSPKSSSSPSWLLLNQSTDATMNFHFDATPLKSHWIFKQPVCIVSSSIYSIPFSFPSNVIHFAPCLFMVCRFPLCPMLCSMILKFSKLSHTWFPFFLSSLGRFHHSPYLLSLWSVFYSLYCSSLLTKLSSFLQTLLTDFSTLRSSSNALQ